MGRSTGPILVAGAITWANTVLIGEREQDLFTSTTTIGVTTGLAAGILYGIEKLSGDFATALAWAALVTVLFVRVQNNPTPMERALKIVRE